MATLARPGRPFTPRVQRAYRLEMAGRTVAFLLVLLALSGLVIFYLGVLTGKGLRDPNQPTAADAAPPAPAPVAAEAKPAPTALNHALQAPTGQIEGLKKDESSAHQQTQQLLSRAKQELALEEVPAQHAAPPVAPAPQPAAPAAAKTAVQPAPVAAPAPARPAAPPAVTAKPAAPAAPAKKKAPAAARAPVPPVAPVPAAAADSEGGFTVQVFSSPQQQHAQEILTDLKKKGFPAYMNQFQAADTRTWYRVRVGKGTRQEADALAAKLRQAAGNLQDLRVMKQ